MTEMLTRQWPLLENSIPYQLPQAVLPNYCIAIHLGITTVRWTDVYFLSNE